MELSKSSQRLNYWQNTPVAPLVISSHFERPIAAHLLSFRRIRKPISSEIVFIWLHTEALGHPVSVVEERNDIVHIENFLRGKSSIEKRLTVTRAAFPGSGGHIPSMIKHCPLPRRQIGLPIINRQDVTQDRITRKFSNCLTM